jgi:DNA-binding transcriptional LysR family regulator
MLKKLKLKHRDVLEANQFSVQKELVKNGLGFSIFLDYVLENLSDKELFRKVSTQQKLRKKLYLVSRPGKILNPLEKRIISQVKALL